MNGLFQEVRTAEMTVNGNWSVEQSPCHSSLAQAIHDALARALVTALLNPSHLNESSSIRLSRLVMTGSR